jgi:hypothetical protein
MLAAGFDLNDPHTYQLLNPDLTKEKFDQMLETAQSQQPKAPQQQSRFRIRHSIWSTRSQKRNIDFMQ